MKAPILTLLTWTSLLWDDFVQTYGELFPGRDLVGLFALPFPQREVALVAANDYLIALLAREPRAKGFLLADPRDPASRTVAPEFVTTSVTSDGPPLQPFANVLTDNPHVRHFSRTEHGYMSADLRQDRLQVRFQAILCTSWFRNCLFGGDSVG